MSTNSLQITEAPGTNEGTRILCLIGPLNMETTPDFLKVARRESFPVLIVEFGEVPYMDSAGLGALIGLYVTAQKAGRRIGITGMSERVLAVVDLNRLTKILAPYTSIADAETALR
jgi:anti-sigma B factor antagonist